MSRMPWILRGHSTWVRNRLLKRYSMDQLMNDETWYKEVIEAPEREFQGIHETDIIQMYEYFSPTVSDLIDIEQKYGNRDPFTVVVSNLIELYHQAFQNALEKSKKTK